MSKRQSLKGYTEVYVRVNAFRDDHPAEDGWAIRTEILNIDSERVLMRAAIVAPDGVEVGSGHAEEVRGSSMVNKTNPVENCETSAIGRALASIGYGGDQSYASTNEIESARSRQANGHQRQTPRPVDLAEHPSMELYKGLEAASGSVPMKSLQAMCTACGLRSEDRDLRLTFAGLVTSRPAPASFKDLPDADREKVYKSLRYIRDMFSEMSDVEEQTRRHAAIAYLVSKGESFETGQDFKAALEAFNTGFWQAAKAMEAGA